jgi:hypothetical protein
MGTMVTAAPNLNESSAEAKPEINAASIQKSNEIVAPAHDHEKKNGSELSLIGATSKKEFEGDIEIDDDVALTFPQRVSVDDVVWNEENIVL